MKKITRIMKMRRMKRMIVRCLMMMMMMRITKMISGVMNYNIELIINKNIYFLLTFTGIKVPLI